MARQNSRRGSDLRRRPPRFEPRPRLLILCEGVVTEVKYLQSLKRSVRHPLVDIEVCGEGSDPKRIVEEAIRRKTVALKAAKREEDAYQAYDQVWCVVDVDQHKRLPDAKVQAAANDIRLAISNPSFELWALLHFQDQTAWIHRDKVREKLKGYVTDYNKELPFERLDPAFESACKRATSLEDRHRRDGTDGNPSTGVHHLCRLIRATRP